MLEAFVAVKAGKWDEVETALREWSPSTPWEREMALQLRFVSLVQVDKLDEAITAMQGTVEDTRNAGLLLQCVYVLRARSVQGTGDSRWRDAFRAIEIGVRARNLRRSWRGDSAEAVALAAEAAVIADDPQQVWLLTQPAPDGQATTAEAADPRVLPIAAIGAALTGRLTQARELLRTAPEGFVKKRVEAEIVSAFPNNHEGTTAVQAWRAAYEAATTEEEMLHALRGLAMEGWTDNAALDALRAGHPEAIADIETSAEVMAISGSDADERLRVFEVRSLLASVRRAQLRLVEDPAAAADILIDAMERWHDPRLLLMALDWYVDAGQWEQAELMAQQHKADRCGCVCRKPHPRRVTCTDTGLRKGEVVSAGGEHDGRSCACDSSISSLSVRSRG